MTKEVEIREKKSAHEADEMTLLRRLDRYLAAMPEDQRRRTLAYLVSKWTDKPASTGNGCKMPGFTGA